MKRFVTILINILVFAPFAKCQRLAIDVMPGFINYLGDLQPRAFTLIEARPAIQVGLSYGLTDNLYLRAFYLAGTVHADDKESNLKYAAGRNLNFTSIIKEGNLTFEYDIFKLTGEGKLTPYVIAGVGFYHFNPYTYDTTGKKVYLRQLSTEGEGLPEYPNRKMYSLYQFNIIGGVGLKYKISERVAIGFEVSFHKLFTDYLDDVSNGYVDKNILLKERGTESVELAFRGDELTPPKSYPNAGTIRGNPNAKDDYYTGLLRFTYNLGGGGDDFSRHNKKSMGCPRNVL